MKTKSFRISFYATVLTMLISILVLMGWFTHNDFLRSIVPGQVKMKFNAALGFLFSSIVLLIHYFEGNNKLRNLVSVLLSLIVSLIGLLTLIEYIFSYNLGIDEEAHKKGLANFLKTGKGSILGKSIEIIAVNKNKTEFDVALSVSPTRIKNKYLFIGFIRDITEQKKAEEKKINLLNELEKVNKELETYSYSVSHGLKSPLCTITSFLQIFLKKYGKKQEEEAIYLLDIINRKTEKMGELIDDLLNFPRLGKKDLEIYFINMHELITRVIEEQKHLNNHSLEIKYNELDNCYGGSTLLQQVWDNLISNAVKYSRTRKKQYIEIGCSKKDTEIIYWVKDNGVEFDMQYASKLFEVFQRLHDKSEFEGTGIGLALVKRIIEKHGGRVWAEGELNKGAAFYFSIPVNDIVPEKNSYYNVSES